MEKHGWPTTFSIGVVTFTEVPRSMDEMSCEDTEGDIIVIPERVPHGFKSIPDHVIYLSVRPDLKKVLKHGYVNPALAKK